MIVLLFVLIPLLAVTTYALVSWARNRQPTSVESGIDAFRREMSALSPDAAPVHRRVGPQHEVATDPREEPRGGPRPSGPPPRPAPRRAGDGDDPGAEAR